MTLHAFLKPDQKETTRQPKIFQDKFTIEDVPLDRKYINELKKIVKYPYPVQLVAIATMFDVPIPSDINEDLTGKVMKEKDGWVWLKQERNVVVSSATSSGKTLLAILFMLKHITIGFGVYTAPLKALAEEKYDEFKSLFPFLKIGAFTGDFQSIKMVDLMGYDIVVTTYEKLDSMLRNHRDLFEQRMSSLVIDEIHNLQTDRGLKVEDVITKIKQMKNVAIMATSATIGKPEQLSGWLDAALIKSSFRPVPLRKGVLLESEKFVEYEDGGKERFDVPKTNCIERIIATKIIEGNQIMYVRMSRRNAEASAGALYRMLIQMGDNYTDPSLTLPITRPKTTGEIDLDKCLKRGVAWHHAGLSQEARSYIERAFREGKIRCLCATTTLAAGINIPSRYVFMDWKRYYPDSVDNPMVPIPVMEALQIAGRAGRPQYDDIGYGIFVCRNDADYNYCIDTYYDGQIESIESQLLKDMKGLYHSIIGNIGTYAKTESEIKEMYKGSFGYYQKRDRMMEKVNIALDSIKRFDEPLVVSKNGTLDLTDFGREVKRYYIEPTDGVIVQKMIKEFDPVTPIGIVHAIARCSSIPKLRIRNVPEYWDDVYDHAKNDLFYKFNINNDDEWKTFQTAALLIGTGFKDEVIYADEDVTMEKLCYVHGVLSGDIQRTAGSGGNFPWMLAFSRALARNQKRYDLMGKLAMIEMQLKYGISSKLVNIARIKHVGKQRAKTLFEIGYCDVQSIAEANMIDIADIKIGKKKIGLGLAKKIIEDANRIVSS